MRNADNDNDPLTFVSLAALTANVTRYLRLDEEKNEDSERQPNAGNTEEEKREAQSRYVDQRLRELAAFERRASGIKNRPGR